MATNDAAARAAAQTFPETTKQVVDYYKTKASDEEKKAIAQAIRQAARTVKQDMRGDEGKKKRKKERKGQEQGQGQASPEAVAAALYGILAQDKEAVVRGDPSKGETRIRGAFDLNEVARKLLSLA
jgi:ADP-ribosylglycohydrolase